MSNEKLRNQLFESAGNVCYTYSAHWIIVNRLKRQQKFFKVIQIILTSLSTGGFLSLVFFSSFWVKIAGACSSAFSLAINLYLLNYNTQEEIKRHIDAANELWDVREAYKTLLVDFDDLSIGQIRSQRDFLNGRISEINKNYAGTDDDSFSEAKKSMNNYIFADGEAKQLLHIDNKP